MLNIGIIGMGKMGLTRALAIRQVGRGTVSVFFDPDTGAMLDGVQRASTPAEIISDPSVDAVFVCTPNFQNFPLTIAALQAKKHVFCEKPPAFTSRDVLQIQAAERDSERKLMYGFNHRHHRSICDMKAAIDSGKYGRILWMRGRYGKSVDDSFFKSWRADRALAGGGILLDQGIHMLDLFLHLGGGFDEVKAMVSNLYWRLDVEDNVFALLRDSGTGITASLHSTMTQWRHLFALEVFLEKGYMVLNGLKTSSGTYGDEVLSIAQNRSAAPAATWQDEERITYHTDASWRSEVDHFLTAIEEDRPIEVGTSNDALEVMRLIERIYANDVG